MKKPFKPMGVAAKPGPAVTPLATRLTEWGRTHQGLAGVRPAVRMRFAFVVLLQPALQTLSELGHRIEVSVPQQLPAQHAEEQFDLIQPRAMDRREVEHHPVAGVAQERPTLRPTLQILFHQRHGAPLGHQPANLQAPVRIQIVHNPVVALKVRVTLPHVAQVGHPVEAGTGFTQIPDHLTRGHDERGQQRSSAIADVLKLAFCRLARPCWLGRVLAAKNLHAGLLIAADQQAALLVLTQRLEVELANVLSLGIEVGIVAVEPIDALVRLEVRRVENAPDGGAADGLAMGLVDNGQREIIKAPARGWLVMRVRLAGSQGDDVQSFVGGKSSAGDRSVGRLAGQRGHA